MERITEALLNNALTTTEGHLQRRLSDEDGLNLTAILERAQRRWPNQDTAESMEEYLADFERLSLKYSLQSVEAALEELRIDPEQQFFPRPDEVASEIERQKHKEAASSDRRATLRYFAKMEEEGRKHSAFRRAWMESGLSIGEFCASEVGKQFD